MNIAFHGSEAPPIKSKKLGNSSGKNKSIHFSKQFKKEIRDWVSGDGCLPWCLVVFFIFKVLAIY